MRARIANSGPDAHAAEGILRNDGHQIEVDPAAPVDLVVVDEWTPETAPQVREARAAGARVTVLAELLLDRAAGPVVGVTGTAGKTSTCRALESLLRSCGRPVAISSTARSGNAWPDHSLAADPGLEDPGTVVIAELTSTHLCHMTRVHPDIAVVTTIRPDHIELHGGVEAYVRAKRRLVTDLRDDDALVLPTDDPDTLVALGPVTGRRWGFGSEVSGSGAFSVQGDVRLVGPGGTATCESPLEEPLLRAALAASAAAMALGVPVADLAGALPSIAPAEHRQAVRKGPAGTTIVDDTMAATPLKVRAALERFGGPALVLVIGGDDSLPGQPVHATAEEESLLGAVLREARDAVGVIVAFGPARSRITPYLAPDLEADDLAGALRAAQEACPAGGTVLVSPMFPLTPREREVAAGRD